MQLTCPAKRRTNANDAPIFGKSSSRMTHFEPQDDNRMYGKQKYFYKGETKLKKRLISITLALVMILSIVPLSFMSVGAAPAAITTQPAGGEVAAGGTMTVNWAFNFTPVKQVLVTFTPGPGGTFKEIAVDVSSLKLGASPVGGYYQIRGYYNENDFVASNKFYVTEFAFTTQPAGGEVAAGGTMTVNWAFNFTPVKQVLVTFTPGPGGELTEIAGDAFSLKLGASPVDGYYQIRGYYNENDFVASNRFYVTETDVLLGDVNGNSKIDTADYIILKRACLGTYTLNDSQSKAGDINKNGKIDTADYIILKRVCLGTYTLK